MWSTRGSWARNENLGQAFFKPDDGLYNPFAGITVAIDQLDTMSISSITDYLDILKSEGETTVPLHFVPHPIEDVERRLEHGTSVNADVFVHEIWERYFPYKFFELVHQVAPRTDEDRVPHICVNSRCLYVASENVNRSGIYNQCPACNTYSFIRTESVVDKTVPRHVVITPGSPSYTYDVRRYAALEAVANLCGDEISIVTTSGRCRLSIKKTHPSIYARGDHFIRAKTNLECLIGEGFSEESGHMMSSLESANMTRLGVTYLLGSNPGINLNPKLSVKFRDEYIDNRWEEEYVQFVHMLRENGVLKVDSAGLGDTLQAAYHMAQRTTGKRPVIKKTGKIVFPTNEIVAAVNPGILLKAFDSTEHAQYTSAEEVFNV